MHINVLQHTPSEGPGLILDWAALYGHTLSVYHPYYFNRLPSLGQTDLLVILGGPMSPNDDLPWIKAERDLIQGCLDQDIPMYGACYGAQQITKTLGYPVSKAPAKEVGWGPIYRQTTRIKDIPAELSVLHWHEEMFEIPETAQLLFSSDLVTNQGFLFGQHVVGLQCHLEPKAQDVQTMVLNDGAYIEGTKLPQQTAASIMAQPMDPKNRQALFAILNHITFDRT